MRKPERTEGSREGGREERGDRRKGYKGGGRV